MCLYNHRTVAAKSETGIHLCVLEIGQEYCLVRVWERLSGKPYLSQDCKEVQSCWATVGRQSAQTVHLTWAPHRWPGVEGQSWLGSRQLLCENEVRKKGGQKSAG